MKVDALEQAFFRNHVTDDALFATGVPQPLDGERHARRPDLRSVYIGLTLKGQRIPYFRAPVWLAFRLMANPANRHERSAAWRNGRPR